MHIRYIVPQHIHAVYLLQHVPFKQKKFAIMPIIFKKYKAYDDNMSKGRVKTDDTDPVKRQR